jgi:truncated hemoglobin YjbI
MPEGSANLLNSNHQRRFGMTCRHLDKLLANMEAALNVSSSESAFPHSAPNAVSADRRVIERFYEKVVKVKADVAALL